ncbi:hypothetical protein E4U57_000374 [Claviceps arundinis]|uniref:Myb-like domain-containing protein n=1 Tax=Claviceps arundinis TaxID=1623583 RepID=A0ABQ7PEV9_9HYPO|nr:hypothetical protein E4U57_000374 [Claviceps arundinis]
MSGTEAPATPRRSARHMSGPSPGSLSTGSGPTRNAQPRGEVRSLASKSEDSFISDGESEYGTEDSIDVDVAGQDGEDAYHGNGGDDDDEDDEDDGNEGEEDDATVTEAREIQYETMISLLPDLKRATDELKQLIDNRDDGHEVSAAILKAKCGAKRGALRAVIESLNYPALQSPFFDFSFLEGSDESQGPEYFSIIRASLAANLVSALDGIQQIFNDDPVDVLSTFKDLDVAFPQLLAESLEHSHLSSLALDIRSQVFILTLAAQPGEPNIDAAIASVFCASEDNHSSHDTSPNDIVGPFKSLLKTGESGEEIKEGALDKLIASRIQELAAVFFEDEEHQGILRLQEKYPLKPLLQDVYKWCLEQYQLVEEAEGQDIASADEQVDPEEYILQDAQESSPSMLDTPIKIPIVRRSPDVQKKEPRVRPKREPSLAPSDCSVETAMLLQKDLGTSLPTTGKRRRGQGVDGGHDDHDGDHDGDQCSESDEFETDARLDHNPDAVRASIKASNPLPPSKRQALPSQQPVSSSMPSSSIPHRATLPHGETSIPASDRPNLENVRARRERTLHRARAQDLGPNPTSHRRLVTASPPPSLPRFPATIRQRNPWSDDDSTLLVQLIAEEHAKWSTIERKHGHRFERPRNQQAYRDRARNMKVDFLLADAVLPPGFDLVVLGKKEEIKVEFGGRNPHRKVDDCDENGRPINTRLRQL